MNKLATALVTASLALHIGAPICNASDYLDYSEQNQDILYDNSEEGEGINFAEINDGEIIEMPEFTESAELSDETVETITISTVSDLFALRDNANTISEYTKGKRFVLENNIDLGGIEWEPIGYNAARTVGDNDAMIRYDFRGEFDGNGHTISNFKMTASDHTYLGFFGMINTGTVKNLTLESVHINYNVSSNRSLSLEYAGILAAFSNYATIENCDISGTINASFSTDKRRILTGMVVGAGMAKIDNCKTTGSISTNTNGTVYAGGIQGYSATSAVDFNAYIRNCTSDVSINSTSESIVYNGGIIARSSNNMTDITNCTYASLPNVTITSANNPSSSASSSPIYAAGIAAYNYCTVKNCSVGNAVLHTTTPVSATVGGIIGRNLGIVDQCSSDADLSVTVVQSSYTGSPAVGGIAGSCGSSYNTTDNIAPVDNIPSINNCTVSDSSSIDVSSDSSNFIAAGGIAGVLYAPSSIENSAAHIDNMSLKSNLSGIYAGGICGYVNGGSIERCISKGKIGEDFSSVGTLYLGGIAGDARVKFFLTYEPKYGVISSELIKSQVYGSYINECSSLMDLTANTESRQYIGGIAGYHTGQYNSTNILYVKPDRDLMINKSSYNGNITVISGGECYAGGISGHTIDGYISNSYAAGNIECLADDSIMRYIGGCVGLMKQNNHEYPSVVASIDNSYSYMNISKPEFARKTITESFIASVSPSNKSNISPTVNNCCSINTAPDTSGAVSLTPEQFNEQSSFNNWDFNNTWEIENTKPTLKFERCRIYEVNCDTNNSLINSVTLSRPVLNSTIYAVIYSDDKFISAHPVTVSSIQSEAFATLPLDFTIPTDGSCELYLWNSDQMPLDDKLAIN